ncbi:MAG: AMP-binding protein [Dysgonamonadaceae bacterium]|jgi:long-chain acyl-CoA synthetase|nr:AMP-binding protein [Dysgonamonadaceae bacterium]
MIEQNFVELYEKSFTKYWDSPAITDYPGDSTYTYGQLAEKIAWMHFLFAEAGLKRGDKVALIGKNHSSWSIVFLSAISYGAVIVPILHEFNPESIEHIIEHSESKVAFVSEPIWARLSRSKFNLPVFSLPSFEPLQGVANPDHFIDDVNDAFKKKYVSEYGKEDVKYAEVSNDTVVCLNYTSGTTGFSKGVMLTANNYAGNVKAAHDLDLLFEYERLLAFLPMAHAYGCAFDFLYALSAGVHVFILGVPPTPQNLLKGFQEVKPHLIISVPLIFEKIYKKKILPTIHKPAMKFLLQVPIVNTLIYKKICKSLMESLGGCFREVIIGGAALGKEVEAFYAKIKFPFTVGYGMTECAPLISYEHHYDFVPTSCGSILKDIMEARIDSPDPENIPGEIQVRGENVMKGYFKNEEATQAAFTGDGWLKTGDSGILRGRMLFIKGRIKTMILSSTGQNIYPEEIEAKLNNLPYVSESVVVQRRNILAALVFPDFPAMEENGISRENLDEIMRENKVQLNKSLAHYEQIAYIELHDTEFEKTPKKSVKRFLYS